MEAGRRTFANEMLFRETEMLLQEGQSVLVSPLGNSMLPFLRGGMDKVEISPLSAGKLRSFSIVFAKYENKYLIHRIIKIKETEIVLLGDGNFRPERIHPEDVLGIVLKVYRPNGRVVYPETFCRRSAAILWFLARPIRRYLLWWITSRRLPGYLRPWKRES